MLKLLLFLILIESVSSDRLRFHLENLVDRNVSACEDFYHHVCSQKVDPKEFYAIQTSSIFKDAVDRLRPAALKNSPIEYIAEYNGKIADDVGDNNYVQLSIARCKNDLACFVADQEYYAKHLATLEVAFNYTNVLPNEPNETKIAKYTADTSVMIDQLIMLMHNKYVVEQIEDGMKFHIALLSRISMIKFMNSNSTLNNFHDVKKIAEKMKIRMIENIKKSTWLQKDKSNKISLAKITETVSAIKVYHDFDQLDKNLSVVQKLSHDFNKLYFTTQRNTGARGLDTLLGLHDAFIAQNHTSSPEMRTFIERIMTNFQAGASYDDKSNSLTVLAPFMYRPSFVTNILKEPFITYFFIGHELHHSLFHPDHRTLLDLYGSRKDCIYDHYRKSCPKFALGGLQGGCMSGKHTFTEDAPDLESYRLAHSMLRERYSDEDLNSSIDKSKTTLGQAFFYYGAIPLCNEDKKIERTLLEAAFHEHSADNIRVNAAYSLMPEFTKAFGCKKGDAMYVEQKDSCYVFGPNS